jgi:hypothetical protein
MTYNEAANRRMKAQMAISATVLVPSAAFADEPGFESVQ